MNIHITKKLSVQNGILLTFDDGPHPDYTPQLLDLLKKNQVKATFFVVGELVEKHPEIIHRMHKEGHTIGIHHFRHVSSWLLNPWQLKKQLSSTEKVISKITKEPVAYYRPPWGHFNLATLSLSRKYDIIMWSHIFKDWKIDTHQLHLLEQQPAEGSILLLHDNGDTSGADRDAPKEMVKYLSRFIAMCKINNTEFLSLKDLNLHKKRQ